MVHVLYVFSCFQFIPTSVVMGRFWTTMIEMGMMERNIVYYYQVCSQHVNFCSGQVGSTSYIFYGQL